MDNTRTKRRREPVTPEQDAARRVSRALSSMAHAEAELHESGRVNSALLDWAMADIRNAMRRCALYVKETKQ